MGLDTEYIGLNGPKVCGD